LTRLLQQTNATTDILLQNVSVLAIDQDSSDRADKPVVARAVTLEVTPEQAQKLTLASSVGTLSLALRNVANAEAIKARTIGLSDLRIGEANVPPPVEAKPPPAPTPVADTPPSVSIVRGTAMSQYEVVRESGSRQVSR